MILSVLPIGVIVRSAVAKEILAVPEILLADVVSVIRCGLQSSSVPLAVRLLLDGWCDEEEAYLRRAAEGEVGNHDE